MSVIKERSSERIESLNVNEETRLFFDLSKTGVSCKYDTEVKQGVFVVVKITDLELKARVIHCNPRVDGQFRIGLQFWDIKADEQKKLDELVEKYSRGVPLECRIVRVLVDSKGGQ